MLFRWGCWGVVVGAGSVGFLVEPLFSGCWSDDCHPCRGGCCGGFFWSGWGCLGAGRCGGVLAAGRGGFLAEPVFSGCWADDCHPCRGGCCGGFVLSGWGCWGAGRCGVVLAAGRGGFLTEPVARGRRADSGFLEQVRRQRLNGPGRGEHQPGRLARHDPACSRLQRRRLTRNCLRHGGPQHPRPGPLQRRGDRVALLEARQQNHPPRQWRPAALPGVAREAPGRVVA